MDLKHPLHIFQEPYSFTNLALLAFLSILLYFLFDYLFFSKNSNHPPSPPKLPIIGNLHQLGYLPHQSLRSLSLKHGPLMLLKIGRIPTLVVSSPEMAEQVMKTQDHIFANRPTIKMMDKMCYGQKNITFAPYGEYWRQTKKAITLHILSNKKVQSLQPIRYDEVMLLLRKISASSSSVNLSEMVTDMTKNIVSRAILGKYLDNDKRRNDEFHYALNKGMELIGEFRVEDFFPSLAWLRKFTRSNDHVNEIFRIIDDLSSAVIDDHVARDKAEKPDFVDVLLSLQDDPNADIAFTRDEIKALFNDLIAAGTDTSYITIEWAMAELVHKPEAMKKVQEEVRGIAGNKSMVEQYDTNAMYYLKAVVKEVLRLHPPAPLLLPRELMEDTKILGYNIPKKCRVIVNAWAIGRHPDYWKTPEEFQPERFLNSSMDYKGHDFQFIPFGAGRRICPGMAFAVATIELVLANLLNRFEWKLPGELRGEDLNMDEAPGLTIRRKESLVLVSEPRFSDDNTSTT
ncbi:Cytochrome P450 71A9 [Acorus gramineus]|uniref:Cytochrome P450 71A9 n=1 Tax=Acorus gramineus TaxID=55184 RepID=A0AAV9B3E8_ACOGR|nr:Cytochrome P450 71A9 [Acorus gramineus]